jgi:DNA-binding NarL/FixJ family response regulator
MIKVAIVEDKSEFRELWRDILSHTEGYACVGNFATFQSAVDNLPLLDADVVLMDIQLSQTEQGIEVIKIVRPFCPKTQFLMFTVFEDNEAIFNALKAGATGYLLKNTSPVQVLEAIRELHEGGAPMSAAIARKVLTNFHPPKQTNDYDLTLQERRILDYLAKGFFYKEVAAEMFLSINTIKQYCHFIYQKLAVSNRTEAINKYFNR